MQRLLLLVLAALAVAGVSAGRNFGGTPARGLLQNTRCPEGCEEGFCVPDASFGGYKCTKCMRDLVTIASDGRCGCPAGRFAKADTSVPDCQDCPKSSYCEGGSFKGEQYPVAVPCGTDLTTIGKRSTSIRQCVNGAGTFYSLDGSTPVATSCAADTFSPGMKKQRACVPCAPGWTTNKLTRRKAASDCMVKEGFFLKGPGQAAPCPKGEWKSGFDAVQSCTRCPQGTTTASQASVSAADCTVLLPGWYASQVVTSGSAPYITEAQKCPQDFFCVGGVPTAKFDTDAPTQLDGTTVQRCPYETWTVAIGSSTASQCMTPPGHKTTITGASSGTTTPCVDGEYRAEWKPAESASKCSVCGEGIYSSNNEQLTRYAITPDATPSSVDVRASATACYIKPGQAMFYSQASRAFYAQNCDADNYGSPNITYGLSAYPCRDCVGGLVASTSYAKSNEFYVMDTGVTPARGGFTSPMACVTPAGYGYNGKSASKCPVGSWNPAGSLSSCTRCGYGLTTPDDAASQVDASNCKIMPGFGFHDNGIIPCPVGKYNDVLRPDTTSPCTPCPLGFTTASTGSTKASDCDTCIPGYGDNIDLTGGKNCSMQCGGSTYGPPDRDNSKQQCIECPTSTGFSFDVMGSNQQFVSYTVSRVGADSPADCLAEFAQIMDDAWFFGGAASLVEVTAPAGGGTLSFDDCVDDCQADASCQYVTYHYEGAACYKKVAGTGSDVIGFKAVIPGDSGDDSNGGNRRLQAAHSSGPVKATAMASGSYTWYLDSAEGMGASNSTTGPTTSVQACLAACDKDGACAAVVMGGMTSATSKPSSCVLLKGDTTPGVFKRSVTKTVASKLNLEALFPAT